VLLTSVAVHLARLTPTKLDVRQRLLNAIVDFFGDDIANSIQGVFGDAGLTDDLIFNAAFRKFTGGPKWLGDRYPDEACIRKYVGVRGMGDFTMITSHPRAVLDCDSVVHSHVTPSRWLTEPGYEAYTKFASVRNPISIVNSSLFSINALTSEYIQRFVPAADDTDALRQHLAMYKFTDLAFFEGIVRFYKAYFDEFMAVRDGYIVMRREDLIERPVETICNLAYRAGIPIEHDHAGQIWAQLDHINLTGAHKHNYRQGKGQVGDWRYWMTNRHLAVIRDHGLEPHMEALGYGKVPTLDEDEYTPFQRTIDELMRSDTVFDDYADRDLFGFAFNKSNIDASRFPFRRYDWKRFTRVERSDFADEDLMHRAWEAAEAAAGRLERVQGTRNRWEGDSQRA